jgi:hypothetical protein
MEENPQHDVCIFCLRCRGRIPDVAARDCTYGFGHEFEEDARRKAPQRQQPAKRASNLCTLCGLHPNNPLSQTNGCAHLYPGAA